MTDNEITPSSIRMAAMNLLAMREYSARELAVKLNKKFDRADSINVELEKLKKNGLQSDERFAQAYVNMRLRQGKGALVIRFELKERGIAETLIDKQFLVHTDWNGLALRAYKKKFGDTAITDIKEKARRIRFLTARGFSADNIQYAFKHCTDNVE